METGVRVERAKAKSLAEEKGMEKKMGGGGYFFRMGWRQSRI